MVTNGHDDDQTRSFTNLAAGTIVSHYIIISKIGAGGMGEVYLAEDTHLDRKVALKFLPLHLSQDEAAKLRFTREAKAAAKLDHPNIIPVFEVGDFEGRPFFAMAHLEGKTLRDVIREGKLSINEAIELTKQICEGLNKAHQAGIVHRDIKPGNIIIDLDKKVRILDFGLATVSDEDKLTKTGSTLGTVGYMSPEQIEGRQVDHRSDLFSVGVILYEMLTGRRPFDGENDVAVARSVMDTSPEPVARYKSGTSGEIQRIIDKALAKNPELRYQRAESILVDLRRVTVSESRKATPHWNRYAVTIALILLAIVLLLVKPWKVASDPSQADIAQGNLLAVMYFDNLADPADSLRLGEIATNLLITDLSESQFINVVSTQRLFDILNSLGHEGAKTIDRSLATEVASRAKARWMLMGSVLQMEPNMVITSQLIELSTGSAIASQRIDGTDKDNIFRLIDRLTVEIKSDLSLPESALQEHDTRISGYTESAEAYRYYLEGWEALFKQNIIEAGSKFRMAIQADSTFPMAYFGLSWATFDSESQINAISKALQYIDQVNEIDRHSIVARKAQLDNDHEGAIKELKELISKTPHEKDIWNWIGVLYKSVDKSKAIESFNKVIEIDSTYKLAYNELAYLYDNLGDLDKSIWAINKYIELAPDEANPYDTRGQLYALNGRLDKAVASYEKALQIDPDFVSSEQKLGNIYMFNGQYEKAEEHYREWASHPDKHVRAAGRLFQARLPAHKGKLQEALRVLDHGIQTDMMELGEGEAVSSKLWIRCILNGMNLKKYDLAIKDINRAITILRRINPNSGFIKHMLANLARFHAAKGDFAAAEKIVDSLKKSEGSESPSQSDYNLARAFIAMEKGQHEEFSKLWQPPTDARFFAADYHLALNHYLAGNTGEAVQIWERTINVYDANRAGWPILSVKAHYWLGRAYESSGWNNKAIEQYQKFLEIWKDADEGLVSIEDARERLSRLKETI